jgi:hypothetical protein
VCTSIVIAHNEQEINQPSHTNQSYFELSLIVHTYEKLRDGKGAPHPMYFWEWIIEGNYTAELYTSKTNKLIQPSYYVGNVTVWNLTMNEYYYLIITKEGYIDQRWYRITDIGDMDWNYLNIVMLKKSAPLFLRVLGNRINWQIFDIIATIYSYIT